MSSGRRYVIIKSLSEAFIGSGFIDFRNKYSAEEVAKYFMFEYCEEDIPELEDRGIRCNIFEFNQVSKAFFELLNKKKAKVSHPDYKNVELDFDMTNRKHAQALKTLFMLLPNPNEKSYGKKRERAVFRFYQLLGFNIDETKFQNNKTKLIQALPYKLYSAKSYDEFKLIPDIFNEMEELYNNSRKEYAEKVNNLASAKIPGVMIQKGNIFIPEPFIPASKSLSRDTLENYIAGNNKVGLSSLLKTYLPIVHGQVIKDSELRSIISNLDKDASSFISEFEKNVDFYSNYTRTQDITVNDTPTNFISLIAAISRYGEQAKFGGIYNLASDDSLAFIRQSTFELDAKDDFLGALISSGVFLQIFNYLPKSKRLENPVSISGTVTGEIKGKQRLRAIEKQGTRRIDLKVSGVSTFQAGLNKNLKLALNILVQQTGLQPGSKIEIDLPVGTYTYNKSPEFSEEFKDSFDPAQDFTPEQISALKKLVASTDSVKSSDSKSPYPDTDEKATSDKQSKSSTDSTNYVPVNPENKPMQGTMIGFKDNNGKNVGIKESKPGKEQLLSVNVDGKDYSYIMQVKNNKKSSTSLNTFSTDITSMFFDGGQTIKIEMTANVLGVNIDKTGDKAVEIKLTDKGYSNLISALGKEEIYIPDPDDTNRYLYFKNNN